MTGDAMLTIRALSKTYANGVHALNNVNLDIPRGMSRLTLFSACTPLA